MTDHQSAFPFAGLQPMDQPTRRERLRTWARSIPPFEWTLCALMIGGTAYAVGCQMGVF